MNNIPQRYKDVLNPRELEYLKKKESEQRRGFFKVFRILMVLCFVLPFIFAWYKAAEGLPAAFSYVRFFIIASVLMFVAGISTYFTYTLYIKRLRLDIINGAKTVETTRITKKLFVPASNTFHFYLDSSSKLSIEVSRTDFEQFNQGDEVNLEFSTFSREYLGYF